MAWVWMELFQILGGFVTGAILAVISINVGTRVVCGGFPFGGTWEMLNWQSKCEAALGEIAGTFEQALIGLTVIGFVIGSPLGVYLVSRLSSHRGSFWPAALGSVLGGGAAVVLLQLVEGVELGEPVVYLMMILAPAFSALGFNLRAAGKSTNGVFIVALLGLTMILVALLGVLLLNPGVEKDGAGHAAEIERLPEGCPPSCSSAKLRLADLNEIDLSGADLSGADLSGASLRGANLSDARLHRANLGYVPQADLVPIADLRKADLRRADLREANLHSALLDDADLSFADLGGANLRLARLRRANLSGANLSGTDLYYADLQGATVSAAQLAAAKTLEGVTLPDGTKHK